MSIFTLGVVFFVVGRSFRFLGPGEPDGPIMIILRNLILGRQRLENSERPLVRMTGNSQTKSIQSSPPAAEAYLLEARIHCGKHNRDSYLFFSNGAHDSHACWFFEPSRKLQNLPCTENIATVFVHRLLMSESILSEHHNGGASSSAGQ